MDLHREFNSDRLGKARSQAFRFLMENWGKSFGHISDDPILERSAVPVWELVYFYERLFVLARHGQIVRKAVPDLFGEVFLWWYIVFFRQQLTPTDWKSAKEVRDLYNWMQQKAARHQWADWAEKHERDYDRLRRIATKVQNR